MSNIKLYINNDLVEIDDNINIPITFNYEDLTNPTSVKNSFSKTITIYGTEKNNKIFGNYFNLTKTIGGGFNASKRVNFQLYYGDTLFYTGYCKLSNIKRENDIIKYELNLYGGLGDFLYLLSEENLNDITFPYDNLQHKINNTFVSNSWVYDITNKNADDINNYIGYMKAYNGIYSDNFENAKLQYGTGLTDNGDISKVFELDEDVDEHQVRSYRSYKQRPYFYMNSLLEKIADSTEYEVNFDSDFANLSNPYWNNLIVSMPLLTEIGKEDSTEYISKFSGKTVDYKNIIYTQELNNAWTITNNPIDIRLETIEDTAGIYDGNGGVNTENAASNIKIDNTTKIRIWAKVKKDTIIAQDDRVQLIPSSGNKVTFINLSPAIGDNLIRYTFTIAASNSVVIDTNFYIENNTSIIDPFVYYKDDIKSASGDYIYYYAVPYYNNQNNSYWDSNNNAWVLSFDDKGLIEKGENQKLNFTATKNLTTYFKLQSYWFPSTVLNNFEIEIEFVNTEINFKLNNQINSDAIITANDILPHDISKMDFLLNWSKIFGLLIEKDKYDKKINILSKNNYFKNYKILDWDDKLDYSKSFDINPIPYITSKYLMEYKDGSTGYESLYKTKYNRQYGSKTILTGYEFDSEEVNLYQSIFEVPIISSEWIKQISIENRDTNTYKIDVIKDQYNYPALFKYNGNIRESVDSTLGLYLKFEPRIADKFNYISDDTNEQIEAGTYMHLDVDTNNVFGDKLIKVEKEPYVTNLLLYTGATTTDNYEYSTLFAKPAENYSNLDVNYYTGKGDLYNRFWDRYISEIFNSNNKIVTAYFNLTPTDMLNFSFSNFVYFNNTIWHPIKIYDYDITKNSSTKVDLLQVNNIDNYINAQDFINNNYYLRIDKYNYIINENGDTIYPEIYTNGTLEVFINNDWITYNSINKTFTAPYNFLLKRTASATITLKETGEQKTIYFEQAANTSYITIPNGGYVINKYNQDISVTLKTNIYYGQNKNGIKITNLSGLTISTPTYVDKDYERTYTYKITIPENTTLKERNFTVTFYNEFDNTIKSTIGIKQSATNIIRTEKVYSLFLEYNVGEVSDFNGSINLYSRDVDDIDTNNFNVLPTSDKWSYDYYFDDDYDEFLSGTTSSTGILYRETVNGPADINLPDLWNYEGNFNYDGITYLPNINPDDGARPEWILSNIKISNNIQYKYYCILFEINAQE